MTSIRESIRNGYKPKVVRVFENDDQVHVRAMSGSDRAQYMDMVEKAKAEGRAMAPLAQIAAMGLCDADGILLYRKDDEGDIAELSGLDGTFLEQVSLKLFAVSGLTQQAEADAGKKSDSPSGDSGSDSP